MELIGIRVDKAMKEALERLATEDGRPLSNYCRQVLLQHLQHMETKKVKSQESEEEVRQVMEFLRKAAAEKKTD